MKFFKWLYGCWNAMLRKFGVVTFASKGTGAKFSDNQNFSKIKGEVMDGGNQGINEEGKKYDYTTEMVVILMIIFALLSRL